MLRLPSVNLFKRIVSRFSVGQLPNVSSTSSMMLMTRAYSSCSSGPAGPEGSGSPKWNPPVIKLENNNWNHMQSFKQKIIYFYNLPYPIKEELYVNGLYGILFVGSVMVFTGLITDIGYLAAIGFGMIGFPIVIVSLGLSTGIYLYRKLIGRDKSLKDIAL